MPTYPLSAPSWKYARMSWRSVNVTAIDESPFNFKQQVFKHPGQRWEVDVQLPAMRRNDADQWIAFLIGLNGQAGTFNLGDNAGRQPKGSAVGFPAVAGANQTGDTLNIDGAQASQTGWLKAGDWIQLGSGSAARLHKLTADANSSASGAVSLEIWPDLRSSPNDNDVVLLRNTQGLFRLASNAAGWTHSEIAIYGIGFTAVEAL